LPTRVFLSAIDTTACDAGIAVVLVIVPMDSEMATGDDTLRVPTPLVGLDI
jgi:hypothetical protein